MKKISTRNAILAGIFGWISFLLADSICFSLLTMKLTWQPAAIISAVFGAMAARWISYSFARNKAVGFCILFVLLTAGVQYLMGYGSMTLSALVAAVFLVVFWLVGMTAKKAE